MTLLHLSREAGVARDGGNLLVHPFQELCGASTSEERERNQIKVDVAQGNHVCTSLLTTVQIFKLVEGFTVWHPTACAPDLNLRPARTWHPRDMLGGTQLHVRCSAVRHVRVHT